MYFLGIKKLACIKQSNYLACFVVLLCSLPNSKPVLAQQSSAMSAVYGRGVHAYFAGNVSQAEQHFTQVIQAGSTDPRVYYFRAMVKLRMGSQFEAENDMRVGASYEARNPGRSHTIGRALQRIQGPGRRTLEKFRRQARLDRLQQGQQQTQQRYEQLNRRGPTVLRNETPVPLGQPIQPPRQLAAPSAPAPGALTMPPQVQAPITTQPAPTGSGSKTDDDPFGAPTPVTPTNDDPFGAEPTPADPAAANSGFTPAPVTEADPFGELPTPPTPGPASSDDDPFGETPSPAPAEEMPEPESTVPEPTEPDADPFGESSPAPTEADDSDPFGESAEEEAADEEMVFDEPAEEPSETPADADDTDPFGESADTADESDPFGDSSESTDDSDPFGDSTEESEEPTDDDSTDDEPEPADDSAPEPDADDPFDPFGAATPAGPAQGLGDAAAGEPSPAIASSPAMAHPAGQFFFALGQFIGSRGQTSAAGADPYADTVVQANFELGPTEDQKATVAIAEVASAEDPFGSDETKAAFDDPFAETPAGDAQAVDEEKSASDSADDDPFGDPFGE